MARNFLALPFGDYLAATGQTLSGKPFNAFPGIQGEMVLAAVSWNEYSVGALPLGNANPNFAVNVNLQAVSSQIASNQWRIRSVYIDNENVNFPVYIYFPDTQFAVSCPANSAGWYRAFSNASKALICGLGISDYDILALSQTNVFFTDVAMVPYLDQEAPTAVQQGISSPQINLGGSGGAILSIGILQSGAWYTGGGLSIAGAGGTGATAQGTLDIYGRFTGVTVTNGGQGYSATPSIAPTSGTSPPAAWQAYTIYSANAKTSYGGWTFITYSGTRGSNVPPPNDPVTWTPLNVPDSQSAVFNSIQSPITGGVSFANEGNFGDRALGDQISSSLFQITATGVVLDNLFNSPYTQGYIYITHLSLNQLAGTGTDDFVIEAASGGTIFDCQSSTVAPMQLKNLQGINLKLPANQTYHVNVTGHAGGPNTYSLDMAWTYSQTSR